MAIKQLPKRSSIRIAAGEVIERPASAAKELIENALDAGGRGSRSRPPVAARRLLRVTDNGIACRGRSRTGDPARHCTSSSTTASPICRTLGFRGESPCPRSDRWRACRSPRGRRRPGKARRSRSPAAGASPAPAVGRYRRHRGRGARPLLRDPGAAEIHERRKRPRRRRSSEVVRRMAIAFPRVRFVLSGSGSHDARIPRNKATTGWRGWRKCSAATFRDNAIEIDAEREDARLTGLCRRADLQPRQLSFSNMPSSTAGRSRTS